MTKSPKKTSNPYKQTDWKKQLSAAAMPNLKKIDESKKQMTWSKKGGPRRRRVAGTGRGLPGLARLGGSNKFGNYKKGNRSVRRRTA